MAKSVSLALRRKIEPIGRDMGFKAGGGGGGMILGALAVEAAGFRMKGVSLSTGAGTFASIGGATGAGATNVGGEDAGLAGRAVAAG